MFAIIAFEDNASNCKTPSALYLLMVLLVSNRKTGSKYQNKDLAYQTLQKFDTATFSR